MLVSVIASVYNCECYIKEMIDSVINQTMQEWEMILHAKIDLKSR